jgi:hypothetical protein
MKKKNRKKILIGKEKHNPNEKEKTQFLLKRKTKTYMHK